MTDPGTTNTWLAIIAAAVVVQAIVTLVMAVLTLRMVRRAAAGLSAVERAIGPLAAKTSACLDDLRFLSETVRRADESARAAADRVVGTARFARAVLAARFWPIVGVAHAVRAAAVLVVSHRRASIRPSDDEIAEARFIAEGGPSYET